jgi:hypothetical protein
MRVASMDDEEEMYFDGENVMPTELLEKVRIAFILLEESKVIDEDDGHLVLRVNRADYEEFCNPTSMFVIH